jgi:hypothetical protein
MSSSFLWEKRYRSQRISYKKKHWSDKGGSVPATHLPCAIRDEDGWKYLPCHTTLNHHDDDVFTFELRDHTEGKPERRERG